MGEFIVDSSQTTEVKLRVTYSETIDISTNTSTITVTDVSMRANYGAQFWPDGYIKCNDIIVCSMQCNSSPVSTVTTTSDGSWHSVGGFIQFGSAAITHASDGSGSCVFTFEKWHVGGSSFHGIWGYNNTSPSYPRTFINPELTVTLTTIPRTSTVSGGNATLGSSGTITVTQAASTLTHKIEVYVGSTLKESIPTSGTTSSTSITFSPTYATYGSSFSSTSTSLQVTIKCLTYNGSTQIGTSQCLATLTMPNNATTQPTVSAVLSDAVTNPGYYVQNKSKLTVVTTATGKYNATIASILVTVDGATYSGASITSRVLATSGANAVSIVVKDSRGFSTTYTTSITVTAYTAPRITGINLYRCDSTGTEQSSGEYIHVICTFNATVLSGQTNSWKVEYKQSTGSTYTEQSSGTLSSASYALNTVCGTFSLDYSWVWRLTVTDFYGDSSISVTVTAEAALMSFHSSGTGIAFGKAAEKSNIFECALPVCGMAASLAGYDAEIVSSTEAHANLNDYVTVGTYAIKANSTAETIDNAPCYMAGALIVRDGMGTTNTPADVDCYRYQIYLRYDACAFYLRCLSKTSGSSTWNVGSWYTFSGTAQS